MHIINSEYQDCIDFLNDCAQICYECFQNCLDSDDIKKRNKLIKNLIELGKQAQLTISFIASNSEYTKEMALISANLAKTTSELCEQFNDELTLLTGQVCLETYKMITKIFNTRE